MLRTVCKSKITNIKITETILDYEGSITIPKTILKKANIFAGERVQIVNKNNGVRLETYTIVGKDEGVICLNGPAARLGYVGDEIFVISYCIMPDEELPLDINVIKLNEGNKL